MSIKPVHDRILVRIAKAEEKVGSLYVPENAKDRPAKGKVLAVGPGKFDPFASPFGDVSSTLVVTQHRQPMCCSVGDEILFSKYSGSPVPGDDDLRIIGNEDVFAVISNDEAF